MTVIMTVASCDTSCATLNSASFSLHEMITSSLGISYLSLSSPLESWLLCFIHSLQLFEAACLTYIASTEHKTSQTLLLSGGVMIYDDSDTDHSAIFPWTSTFISKTEGVQGLGKRLGLHTDAISSLICLTTFCHSATLHLLMSLFLVAGTCLELNFRHLLQSSFFKSHPWIKFRYYHICRICIALLP